MPRKIIHDDSIERWNLRRRKWMNEWSSTEWIVVNWMNIPRNESISNMNEYMNEYENDPY